MSLTSSQAAYSRYLSTGKRPLPAVERAVPGLGTALVGRPSTEQLVALLDVRGSEQSSKDLADALRAAVESWPEAKDVYEVLVGVEGRVPDGLVPVVLSRGVRAVPTHDAIAEAIGLPPGWRNSQARMIDQALGLLTRQGEEPTIARMKVHAKGEPHDARDWMVRFFGTDSPKPRVMYLQAEAGKGKSTLLANAVREIAVRQSGTLALYVPLRNIRGMGGVSWGDIAACVGILGGAAERLARAAQCGLVSVALDGLDEVAGRYDPSLVKQVVSTVLQELRGPQSRLLLSGRTTEGTLLSPEDVETVVLDLPDSDTDDFSTYVSAVLDASIALWPEVAPRIPEPPNLTGLGDVSPTSAQRDALESWIKTIFDNYGKDRSLFFVQSLACLGRNYQMDGNRRLLVTDGDRTTPHTEPSLLDVCLLAISLACVREETKIAEYASRFFPAKRQIKLLTEYALLASGQDGTATHLNEVARQVFDLDPTTQNEEFTAVLRQMQKHALLFAGSSEGTRTGSWTPAFLSDWVRAALVTRAWQERTRGLSPGATSETIAEQVASMEKGRIAFHYLLAGQVQAAGREEAVALWSALHRAALAGNPEACANSWHLYAGLDEEWRTLLHEPLPNLCEFSDLSDLQVDAATIDGGLSGNMAILVGARFSECALTNSTLTSCDLTNAQFSNCVLRNVTIEFCTGPIFFDGCDLEDVQIRDCQGGALPSICMTDCRVLGSTSIRQSREVTPGEYGPVVTITDCHGPEDGREVLSGQWLGLDKGEIRSAFLQADAESADPAAQCLHRLLKPFFPRRMGVRGDLQARRYIRSSAIGRGVFPEGTPNTPELLAVLQAEGFTSGGRQGRVYAPWSGVAGGGEQDIVMRNELIAFMQSGERSKTVERMLARVRRAMHGP